MGKNTWWLFEETIGFRWAFPVGSVLSRCASWGNPEPAPGMLLHFDACRRCMSYPLENTQSLALCFPPWLHLDPMIMPGSSVDFECSWASLSKCYTIHTDLILNIARGSQSY